MTASPKRECSEEQIVRFIVDACPRTKFKGGIEKHYKTES